MTALAEPVARAMVVVNGSAPPVAGGAVTAAALLAAALLLASGPPGRLRLLALTAPGGVPAAPVPPLRTRWIVVGAGALAALVWALAGPVPGIVAGIAAAVTGAVAARATAARVGLTDTTSSDLACCWELLAVCLEAGLAVPAAVAAAAGPLDGSAGALLRRVSGLLELGADPADAWGIAQDVPALAAFARAAGRSAGTGAALAQIGRAEGDRLRAELLDSAQARAQRAGVLITGPLGLCFLPAFLVLGIAPVVVGLAGEALAQW